jgi:VanZ family protein
MAVLIAGLWFALRPIDRSSGRFFFLPPRWAEWLDFNDWAVNFAAFGLFAWLTVRLFGGDSRRWVALLAVLLMAIGILCIEYLQAGIPGRSVDVRDVIMGIAGAVVGAIAATRSSPTKIQNRQS